MGPAHLPHYGHRLGLLATNGGFLHSLIPRTVTHTRGAGVQGSDLGLMAWRTYIQYPSSEFIEIVYLYIRNYQFDYALRNLRLEPGPPICCGEQKFTHCNGTSILYRAILGLA